MKRLFSLLILLPLVFSFIAGGCTGETANQKGPITVGSKIDVEGSLLSQMIILMLRSEGFEVVDKSQFGPTSVVKKALETGELDIYPEYTGNGAFFFDEADSDVWKDAQKGYERVKLLDGEANGVIWLATAPANNTWAIAVPRALAEEHGLSTLADFAAYINGGGTVKLIGSEEFVNSPAALPAFQEAYEFTLRKDQILTVSSGDTTQTEKAAAEGTDDVNAAMAYGTDGAIDALNLVILDDPRGVQPVYEPAPRVRGQIMEDYPEIADILNPVFQSLNLEILQSLNARIGVQGENPADVAREYLISKGFLKE
jgi:osmoprotectant transport system substrate-binding protein